MKKLCEYFNVPNRTQSLDWAIFPSSKTKRYFFPNKFSPYKKAHRSVSFHCDISGWQLWVSSRWTEGPLDIRSFSSAMTSLAISGTPFGVRGLSFRSCWWWWWFSYLCSGSGVLSIRMALFGGGGGGGGGTDGSRRVLKVYYVIH